MATKGEMIFVNADPREWDEFVHNAEVQVARKAFCEGGYDEYFDRQDLTPLAFHDRLTVLALIWGD